MSIMRRAAYAAGMMMRETGQALDRLGCSFQGRYAYKEHLSRHRQVMNLELKKPIISSDVFLAPNASIIGNVEIQSFASIWYGCVIRGDSAPIEIGEKACINDRVVIRGGSRISKESYIGAGSVIDGANIGENCSIGSGVIVNNGCIVGKGSIIRSGSFLPDNTKTGQNEIWSGCPAKKIDVVNDIEKSENLNLIDQSVLLASAHATECGKTHDQIEAEALRQELLEERTEDYNSHVGILGMENQVIEGQAQLIEAEREAQRKAGAPSS